MQQSQWDDKKTKIQEKKAKAGVGGWMAGLTFYNGDTFPIITERRKNENLQMRSWSSNTLTFI